MTEAKKRELRKRIRTWLSQVLSNAADGAEMPDADSDEEDEFMREEIRSIAERIRT